MPLSASTLPVQLTGFVGREPELARLRELIADSRLLTLTGAGGSGKTRLALEAVKRIQEARETEIAWIELASLGDPALLAGHLALALGLRVEGGGSAEQALAALLRERRMLLVLDNCEHLVDECARIVESLLRTCPQLCVLATSREALGVGGERSWLVPALSLPAAHPTLTLEEAGAAEAVRLFVERARDVLPSFTLESSNVQSIARICHRLDGLPLAIELAAARVTVLTPAQIAARLDDRFGLLRSPARSALPRHRTLRAAVDWSYELLSEAERILLERLSVFAGGFTLDAAEQVCAGPPLQESEILEQIATLATRSLVAMQEENGHARYRLLETIRDYAAARRAERSATDDIGEKHARHFLALSESLEPDMVLGRPATLLRMDTEHDNIRAALNWSAAQRKGSRYGLPLCAAVTWYWFHRQLWQEGFAHVEAAMATAVDPAPPHLAAALHTLGIFGLYVAHPLSRQRLEEAERIWRSIGDLRRLTFTLVCRTVEASLRRDPLAARLCADETIAVARATGDSWLLALATAHALVPVLVWERQWETAERRLIEAEQAYRNHGYAIGFAYTLDTRAFVALQLGNLREAVLLARESIRTDTQNQSRWLAGRTLRILGAVAYAEHKLDRAAFLFGAAAGMYAAIGAGSLTEERRAVNELPERIQAAMPADAFAAAWESGLSASFDQAVAFALADETGSDRVSGAGETVAARTEHGSSSAPSSETATLTVNALGPLEILSAGTPLPPDALRNARPRELLLYLLAHPDGRTRDQIGLDFWPDVSSAQVKNNFHVALHHLRKALGHGLSIEHEQGRYRIGDGTAVEFDVHRFELSVRAALRDLQAALDVDDSASTSAAAEALAAALSLYRGQFLETERVGDWHLPLREQLARTFQEGLDALAACHEAREEHAAAVTVLQRLVSADSLNEVGVRRLMLALARNGRRHEALRAFQRLEAELAAELGVAPERKTLRLAEEIRRADSTHA